MKTYSPAIYFFTLIFFILSSCKKDNIIQPLDTVKEDISNGRVVNVDSIPESFKEVERGTTTLIVDLRKIRKLEIISNSVQFEFNQAEFSHRDTTISINQFLDIAQILIPNETLSEEETTIISNGNLSVKATVRNNNGDLICEKTFSFLSNGSRLVFEEQDILIDIPNQNESFSLEYGIPYFIQNKYLGGVWTIDSGFTYSGEGVHIRESNLMDPSVNYQEVIFHKVQGADNEVYITFLHSPKVVSIRGGEDPITSEINYYLGLSDDKETINDDLNECYTKLKIVKSGKYVKFKDCCGLNRFLGIHNAYSSTADFPPFLAFENESYPNNEDQQLFRLIPSDLIYEIESSGYDFGQLTFSNNQISVAYQEEIRNCSGATLTETVGTVRTEESTRELSTEESLELYSGSEFSVGVDVGVEAGFSAFGASVTASLNVSTSYSYTTSSTTSSTNYYGQTETIIEETSREREIEIPPYNQLSVFDGVSIVEAIPIDYVHRYKLKAKSATTNQYLSSETLQTVLESSNFEGIIYNEGSDFVDVSIRGKFYVDKLIKTKTELIDLGPCGN